MALTPEELAMMTEEERAGYEEDDEDEGDEDGADDDADDDAESEDSADDDADDGDGEDEDDGEDDGGEEREPGKAAGRDDGADGQSGDQDGRPRVAPLITVDVPADAQEQLKAFETKRDELATQFEDGELTSKEFMAALRQVEKDEGELQWLIRKADLAKETAQQQAVNAWYGAVDEFMAEYPQIKANEVVYNAFDSIVRQITADPKNHNLSDRKQLEMAHKQWSEALNIEQAKPAGKKEEGKKDVGKKGKRDIPPTLANVPASEMSETDDGEYAHLDKLATTDPLAYEAALAKMTPEQADRYLRSA